MPSRRSDRPRILFVTGRLAEFALRQVLDDLAPRAGFVGRGRRPADLGGRPDDARSGSRGTWRCPPGIDRVILPGHCRGDLVRGREKAGTPVELGPEDLRDLPALLRPGRRPARGLRRASTSRSSPRSTTPRGSRSDEILAKADRFAAEGADRIDLGCDPGGPWAGRRRRGRGPARPGLPGLDRQLRPGRGRPRPSRRGPTWS